jgi:adenine-specific DNA-methyltransferase
VAYKNRQNMKNTQELLDQISELKNQVDKLKQKKKYGLVWENKPEIFEEESQNALPVLIEKGERFKDIVSDKEEDFNILIEGDNYHSLSVLKYTHRNKINVIYIDPPYNTGAKDLKYNNDYVD